jgi:hypothetical protein
MIVRIFIARIFILLCVCCVSSANTQTGITGRVIDAEGAAIAKARVLVHWDPSGSRIGLTDNIGAAQDVIAVTDSDGKYSVPIPAGFYDVFISAMAFTPRAAKLRVKQGQRVTYNAKLNADPLVTRELGDTFYTAPKKR